jgi:elongation factor Ts
MNISAKDAMALREKTGAGMMDCKKALTEANGDFEKAMDILREKGLARARKRDEKTADEGLIQGYISEDGKIAALLELNCETDFVARTPDFQTFAATLCQEIALKNPSSEAWYELLINGVKAGEALDALASKMGEKMQMRRFVRYQTSSGMFDIYIHGPGKLGVILEFEAEGKMEVVKNLAHELSLQIAAANPLSISRSEVPPEAIEKEKEIYRAQARNEGKPENIIEKIAEGKLNKYYQEICLLEQPFIKEQKISVTQHLTSKTKELNIKLSPKRFARLALGGN